MTSNNVKDEEEAMDTSADNLKTKYVVARARNGGKSKIVYVEVLDID